MIFTFPSFFSRLITLLLVSLSDAETNIVQSGGSVKHQNPGNRNEMQGFPQRKGQRTVEKRKISWKNPGPARRRTGEPILHNFPNARHSDIFAFYDVAREHRLPHFGTSTVSFQGR